MERAWKWHRPAWIIWLGWAALSWLSPAVADTVRLANGDVLTGTVVSFDEKSLALQTAYAGDVAIAAGDVEWLATEGDVVVQMRDGREVVGRLVVTDDGAMQIEDGEGVATPLTLAEVASLAPPPPPTPWFRYSGEINVGFNAATGNTETQAYHISFQTRPEFGDNVVLLGGQLNRSEATVAGTNETTASNWRVFGQYDRYFTEHWYALVNNTWENDDLKDLNVRITAATGVGYRFWNDAMRFLTVELGPAFVYENFARFDTLLDPEDPTSVVSENPDRNYMTARWALNFDHGVFNPTTRFYHNHSALIRVDNADTFIYLSTTGLRFDLIANITAALEVQFDWNNDPAMGAKEEDLRYLFKLGYTF